MISIDSLKRRVHAIAEPLKSVLIRRFHRIVNIEQRTLSQDAATKEFKPPLSKGQVVDCDFIGQGTIIDKGHPAVIWAADKRNEHIIVIPLTSKNRSGVAAPFSLGIIAGLDEPGEEKDSIAKVNQPQSISRKSVHILTKKLADGTRMPLQLSELQLRKVTDIFRTYHLKEPHLKDVLEKSAGYTIPTSPLDTYRDMLFRPVQFMVQDNELWCKTHDCATWTMISLTKVNDVMKNSERRTFLSELFSGDAAREKTAERAVATQLAAATKETP